MKKYVAILAIGLSFMAHANPGDSTEIKDRVDHISLTPFYTPFLTMYKVVDNSTEIWKIAFAIIEDEGDEIYAKRKTGSSRSTCVNGTCDREWIINIYSKDYTGTKEGVRLQRILFKRNAELKRTSVVYDQESYELCTFVMNMTKNDGSPYPNPSEATFKVILGAHPEEKNETKGIVTHQGGVVHWPGQ